MSSWRFRDRGIFPEVEYGRERGMMMAGWAARRTWEELEAGLADFFGLFGDAKI